VYVARVAFGANPQQTLLALREAEAFPGPSLVIAYSHCIAHGIDMQAGLRQQAHAVTSGYWPLVRYNPAVRASGENPFSLDSGAPRTSFRDYAYAELRYRMLQHTKPEEAESLMQQAEEAVRQRWKTYAELAARGT
jgi:pyruvate-ferredoxin/flavodoxin oxidoreductase